MTRRRRTPILALPARCLTGAAALVLLVTGAVVPSPSASGNAALDTRADRPDWTMMVYAVGDTDNVAELMVQNMTTLVEIPDDADVNIVVLMDLPAKSDPSAATSTLPGMPDFTTGKLMVLDGGRYNEIRDLGEIAMGRPDTLASFIEEAAGRFPADKYGLVLFDHGAGSHGGYIDIDPPTSGLSVHDIRTGMAAGMARAGIDRFEMLYHAACLMANYETATALAPLAGTMAASEELMFHYPVSASGFEPLGYNGTGFDVAAAQVEGYRDLLDQPDHGRDLRELMAMSVVDGDAVPRLDAALTAFAEAVIPKMDELAPDIARARAKTLEFAKPFGAGGFELVDLGDFLRHLDGIPEDVAVARDAAFAALQQVVKYQVTGRGTEQATGLNVFFPVDPRLVGTYFEDGTAPQGWGQLLGAFLEAQASAPPSGAGFTQETAQVVSEGAEGIKIQGQLSGGEVVDADTYVLSRMGEQERAYSLLLPGYLDAGGQGAVQGVWDYSRVTLSDGTMTIPVTTALQPQSGGLRGTFEAEYTNVDGSKYDFLFTILMSSEGEILAFDLANVTPQGVAGAQLEYGGTLTPYLYVPSSQGASRVLSSQTLPFGESGFEVGFTRLPTGAPFEMQVVARDLSGQRIGARVEEQVS